MATLEWVARAVGGRLTGDAVPFASVTQDTRNLQGGALYVALRGDRFDGHSFVRRAAALGAAGALVAERCDSALPQVEVDDTLVALQQMARQWLLGFDTPVVAVTGSNGKTTVKQMLAAILGGVGPTLATAGNLNNQIGLPLTLMRLTADHRFAVLEMGASKPGDIAELVGIARPQVAIVTHAAAAHLAGFGGLDGVARTKGEIYSGLRPGGTAVINADDPYAERWAHMAADHAQLRFGLEQAAEVTASSLDLSPLDSGFTLHVGGVTQALRLPVSGRHNVMNALAAAAAAHALGIDISDIAAGLERLEPAPGRLTPRRAQVGAAILDDTYNANPASLKAALDVLANADGKRWLALGNMNELGTDAVAAHVEAGRQARAAGVQRLFALGDLATHAAEGFGDGAVLADSMEQLCAQVSSEIGSDVCLLVKGSRGARMERLVQALVTGEAG